MKKQKNVSSQLYEIIVPLNEAVAAEDGLFDDCPICQELRRQAAQGQTDIPVQVDIDDMN